MWRIFSGYLKTITFPILTQIFFSRYWNNIASGEDDDFTEVIHPGVFCLLAWLVGFAFFLSQAAQMSTRDCSHLHILAKTL